MKELFEIVLGYLFYIYHEKKIFYTVLFSLLYVIYYRFFRYYKFIQAEHYTKGKHNIGRTIPSYPNGWFRILASSELDVGGVKYINLHGENMAVFRGVDKSVYALDAYCSHLNANLGIGGTVVHDRCIQCPFHAWIFDGKTGNCVVGKDYKPREAIRYEYEYENFECENEKIKTSKVAETQPKEKCTLNPKEKQIIRLRKFPVLERCGSIYVWFNATDLLNFKKTNENVEHSEYPYEPLDISQYQKTLEYRGTSLNTVRCHVQDIAENGGDILHFLYVHSTLIPYLVKGFWDAKWVNAADPELREKVTLKGNEVFNKFRMDLLDKYITEKNKHYIGVIALENNITIAGIPKHFGFFSLTGFQVGPGLVYLFIKSPIFNICLQQYIESKDKFTQYVYHDIYSSKYLPYWFSALMLRMEASQVLNDGVVWDNKKFSISPYLNPAVNPADKTLLNWRTWYSQFYTDCREYEDHKKKESLDW